MMRKIIVILGLSCAINAIEIDIPILDISSIVGDEDTCSDTVGDSELQDNFNNLANKLDEIMSGYGIAYIVNSGFMEDTYLNLLNSFENFFKNLSDDMKEEYNLNSLGASGYQSFRARSDKKSKFVQDDKKLEPYFLESFKFLWKNGNISNGSSMKLDASDQLNFNENKIVEKLKDSSIKYFNDMLLIGNTIIKLLSHAYTNGNDNKYFENIINSDPICELKLSHYQRNKEYYLNLENDKNYKNDKNDKNINDEKNDDYYQRNKGHSDLGFITLNTPDMNVFGLQALIENEWIDVNCTQALIKHNNNDNDNNHNSATSCFVLNGGNILVETSKTKYKAVQHRVMLEEESRVSIITFIGANQWSYDEYFSG